MGSGRRFEGGEPPYLLVGLGNPGSKYAGTRHNVGSDAVELLASRWGCSLRSEKGTRSRMGRIVVAGRPIVACVPETFMNDSGIAAAALVKRFEIEDFSKVIVVHDELDLPSGRVKIKAGGGTAGHNGLKSIVGHLHDKGFVRVRIGIGKPDPGSHGVDFVLGRPGSAEKRVLAAAEESAAEAVEEILASGLDAAMNKFNVSSPDYPLPAGDLQ